MGKRTGNPRGRPKGAKNKRTVAREEAVRTLAVQLDEQIPGAFQGDAHAFLMALYKDPRLDLDLRAECARAAINYEKPRLASIEGRLSATVTLEKLVSASLEEAK